MNPRTWGWDVRCVALSVWLVGLVAAAGVAPCLAEEQPADKPGDAAAAAVRKHLEQNFKGLNEMLLNGVVPLDEPVLATAMPDFRFHLLRVRQYPVAMMVPEGLGVSNIFAVNVKVDPAAVTHMMTAAQLQEFCAKQLTAKDEKTARAAAHAYAALRKELAQDGFFRFTIDPDKFDVKGQAGDLTVTAKVEVVPGGRNKGQIQSTLAFKGDKGTFSVVEEKEELEAGIRPKCQSLKLLAPDRAVRAAAEHDLLIMGVNALPYLRMQTGKTEGALRTAILDLIRRIEGGEHIPGGQPPAN